MTEIITTIITISIGLILFLAGLFLGKKGVYISGMGAGLFIILGVMMLTNPLQMIIGENITYVYGDNYTDNWDYDYSNPQSTNTLNLFHENRTKNYTDMDPIINYTLSMIFILIGLAGIIYAGVEHNEQKYSE